jgi:methylmalonyl-CoA decarboxylase
MKLIQINTIGNISEIVINNEEKRNSLSTILLQDFISALDKVEASHARALIIRAKKGSKVWSSGFNIDELPMPGIDPVPYNHPLEQLIRRLQEVKIPLIAMIEGSVWGGACDLALTCDILIGTNKSTFAITPAKIGVPYNSLGIQRILNRMQPNIAKELFFTAQPISAERAFQIGILNHLVPAEDLESFTYEMANTIALNSPLSISVIKKQIDMLSRSKPIPVESLSLIDELRQIAYNSNDYKEGKLAFEERRRPIFNGKPNALPSFSADIN